MIANKIYNTKAADWLLLCFKVSIFIFPTLAEDLPLPLQAI